MLDISCRRTDQHFKSIHPEETYKDLQFRLEMFVC